MTTAEMYLALLAFVFFAALVIVVALGRIDARAAAELAKDNQRLEQKVRHLQERNAELRDELDAREPGRPSLTAEWTAYVAELPLTHPGDNR